MTGSWSVAGVDPRNLQLWLEAGNDVFVDVRTPRVVWHAVPRVWAISHKSTSDFLTV